MLEVTMAHESEIPEGCGGVWNAAAQGTNEESMLRGAAREAARTHLPQIVHLGNGRTVKIEPQDTAA